MGLLRIIGANWRFVVGVLLTAGFTWICATCQKRGDLIVTMKRHIGQLDSLITRKDDTLFVVRDQLASLQKDTARLNGVIDQQTISNLNLKAQLSAGERAALLTDQAITEGKKQVNNLVDQLSAVGKKQAADAGLADENLSFEGKGTTVDDVEINDRIAKLTNYGKVYRDSTQALKHVVGQQAERIVQQDGIIREKDDQLSDLEKDLNGYRNADAIEAVIDKKRFLNWKLKKDARKTINDIRAGRIKPKKP